MDYREYDFYNKKRKIEFIDHCIEERIQKEGIADGRICGNKKVESEIKYTVCRVMNSIAEYERKFDKDFTDFGPNEMKYVIANYVSVSITASHQRKIMAILRKYLKYCTISSIITTKQYRSHPITFDIQLNEYSDKALLNQIKNANELQIISPSDCFIFRTEEQFFDYVETMFEKDRFYAAGALASLFYYGFPIGVIVNLLKSDVNESKRTVKDVTIDNDVAFKMIIRARDIDSYEYYRSDSTEIVRLTVKDGPHLVRATGRGKEGGFSDDTISIAQGSRLRLMEDMAADELPAGSPYKNVRIRGNMILNLRSFHKLNEIEEIFGPDEVKGELKNESHEYPDMNYNKYRRMKLRSRDI